MNDYSLGFRRIDVQRLVGVLDGHGGRLLLHLVFPGVKNVFEQFDGLRDRPVGEFDGVAQVAQVVDIAEQLVLQLRIADDANNEESKNIRKNVIYYNKKRKKIRKVYNTFSIFFKIFR